MTNPEKNDIPAQTAGSEADNPAFLLPDESLDQLAGGAGSPGDATDLGNIEDLKAEFQELTKQTDQLVRAEARRLDEISKKLKENN